MKRRNFIITLIGTSAAGVAGLALTQGKLSSRIPSGGNPLGLARISRTGYALGTEVRLTVFHRDHRQGGRAIDAAFSAIDRVERVMSLYREDSQLAHLNRYGRLSDPDPGLVGVLRAASDLSERTDGVFDVTIQPLWTLHKACAAGGTAASAEAIAEARAKVDWRRVEINEDRLALHGEGTQVTLNGIAQGYAADQVARALREFGVSHALIDTGEIGAMGHHAEKDAWNIGIKHPRDSASFLETAALCDRCLATSGDYESYFSPDFRLHHLLDPRTGRSPLELCSVSVAAPTAMQADGLSTAACLLGLRRGIELIEATAQADALFVTKDGDVRRTAGFPAVA